MDPLQLWAGVRFAAQNGNTGGLLTAAAQNGLHLSAITAQPGGFCARCAAWRYPELSRLARRYRVRLRVQKRDGLFFRLRPLLRRRGLWAGLFLFLPLLLWLQGAVWATDFTTLTPGQRARTEVILRQQALSAGEFVSEEKLTAGEYALLQSGEFSWASLNFSKGRLIVEAAAAKPVPDIAPWHYRPGGGYCAGNQPHQRHHAGDSRAGRGSRTGTYWNGPHGAGWDFDLSACGRSGAGPV